ncbi:NADPH:quinone reductase-like Zn-dependent oxidoreductase [Streptomyces netropsis]|uniref:NADPH:quinone reductase-like Zn-dependent oxidoreductase n=1 Tax=Streptomyces netropsis TaxID=55404 RepID=A0A7W7LC39_STRNE|nr:NADPH:quinone reductase-like Zn-dependent oxidoreductase [Streptomyces netropsis]GGR10611.1 hypothetical protein GCM10010219_14130 [Streptomyces netropsis]
MPKAVRYDEFGGVDVLRVDEVERPVPGDGQVLVRVKAAGINPSEAVIRTGALATCSRRRSRPGRAATSPGSSRRSAPGSPDSRPATR